RASMACSLAVRVPYLDHELVEFILSLNENVYFKKNEQKYLLYRNIKDHLPEKILSRPKQGFVGPDSYYQNFEWYKKIILEGNLIKNKIIKKDTINNWLSIKDHWRLWKVAVMELWYRKWVNESF
ncbi:MAG: hypothetical protein HY738_04720, partial [Bacteroidia bacterium]|nr:hypothetical protein [Bacteroidia bacterium]